MENAQGRSVLYIRAYLNGFPVDGMQTVLFLAEIIEREKTARAEAENSACTTHAWLCVVVDLKQGMLWVKFKPSIVHA